MFYCEITSHRQLEKAEKLLKKHGYKSIGSPDSVTVWANQFHEAEFILYQTKYGEYSAMMNQLFELTKKDFVDYEKVDVKNLKRYLKGELNE